MKYDIIMYKNGFEKSTKASVATFSEARAAFNSLLLDYTEQGCENSLMFSIALMRGDTVVRIATLNTVISA